MVAYLPVASNATYGAAMVRSLEATVVSGVEADLGEGPIWHTETEAVWWIDITGRQLLCTDPSTGQTEHTPVASMPGSMFVTEDQQLITARPGGIQLDESMLVPFEPNDQRVRANDGKVDPSGRIVVGTMGFDAEPGLGSLLRIDVEQGTCERLLSDLTISNGLAWSGDGASMFHIDSPTQQVRRYGYPVLGAGEVVVEIPPSVGTPDGMTIDTEGCLWVALWGGGAVHRYTPEGVLDAVVTVPASNVTCCTFGGTDLDQLFITTARADAYEDDLGGSLFVCSVNAEGTSEQRLARVA